MAQTQVPIYKYGGMTKEKKFTQEKLLVYVPRKLRNDVLGGGVVIRSQGNTSPCDLRGERDGDRGKKITQKKL